MPRARKTLAERGGGELLSAVAEGIGTLGRPTGETHPSNRYPQNITVPGAGSMRRDTSPCRASRDDAKAGLGAVDMENTLRV